MNRIFGWSRRRPRHERADQIFIDYEQFLSGSNL